jgi:pyruvate carboxylase
VVEFAPSIAWTTGAQESALRDKIAKQVGLQRALCSFDQDGKAYFIEMNTRIQVEHAVTEMITGRNLVQAQILVAEGKKLSDPEINIPGQDDIHMGGYAIQCRLTTEDPANNLPWTAPSPPTAHRPVSGSASMRETPQPAPRSPPITIRSWSRSPAGG